MDRIRKKGEEKGRRKEEKRRENYDMMFHDQTHDAT